MAKSVLHGKLAFIFNLSSFLQKYGTSSDDLESELLKLAHKLELEASFMATPTSISMALTDRDGEVLSHMARVFPGAIDLFKLNEAKKIIDEVHSENLDYQQASIKIKNLDSKSSIYGFGTRLLGFPLTSSGLTYLVGGSLEDMMASFITGLFVALLVFSLNFKNIDAVKETIIAILATCAAFLLKTQFESLNVQIIVMTSLIVLIPGLSLTIAISELASKHLVSGTARLMGALVDFGKITVGIVAGYHMASGFGISTGKSSLQTTSFLYEIAAIVVCAFSVAIIFNSSKRDIKWIVLTCLITMLTLKMTNLIFVHNIAIFLSALTAGVISNAYARTRRATSAALLLPAIIFLVPGSIGMKGLHLLLEHQYVLGLEEVMRAAILAVMIVTGIFFSEIIASPNPKKGRMVG